MKPASGKVTGGGEGERLVPSGREEIGLGDIKKADLRWVAI
jgi:hypothetical protein